MGAGGGVGCVCSISISKFQLTQNKLYGEMFLGMGGGRGGGVGWV